MTSRRHSARDTFAAVLVLVLALRLALLLVDLVCRVLAWTLLRVCWGLEWAIGHLADERPRVILPVATRPTPMPLQAQRVIDSGRIPVPPTKDDELAKFMRVLGTKDRAFAEKLLASGTRLPVSR